MFIIINLDEIQLLELLCNLADSSFLASFELQKLNCVFKTILGHG